MVRPLILLSAVPERDVSAVSIYNLANSSHSLICGVLACHTHGSYDCKEYSDDEDPSVPNIQNESEIAVHSEHHRVNGEHGDILRKQNARLSKNRQPEVLTTPLDYCSEKCHLHKKAFQNSQLSHEKVLDIKSFVTTLRSEINACDIAFLLDIPCCQAHAEIEKMLRDCEGDTQIEPSNERRKASIPWYDNKKKVLIDSPTEWRTLTKASQPEECDQPFPCAHDGPCTKEKGCECAISNILCESFCGCVDCPRKFTGKHYFPFKIRAFTVFETALSSNI